MFRHVRSLWHHQRVFVVVFVISFGIGGLALILLTHAATPTASLEPETGSLSSTTITTDSTASGGRAVRFSPPATRPLYLGTLMTQPAHAAEESSKGAKVAMLELKWQFYETADGQFNTGYITNMKNQFQDLRDAGMQVTLGMGVHYTPAWVKVLPNSAYVDQNGVASNDLNVVFNQKIRQKVQEYYAQIDRDFGLENFWAIRLTSGGNGEMLYPDGQTYFAYDINAQNGPDMPTTMARNPFPGWKPGNTSITKTQVGQWADWYIKALDDVANWQMTYLTSLGFTGYYQMLTPGSGMRPNGYTSDINTYLPKSYTAVGAVWHKFYEFLPNKKNVVVYISSVADNSGSNDSCTPTDASQALTSTALNSWSATRWQARIASQYGLQLAGENPGYNNPAKYNAFYVDTSATGMMATAIRQAQTCNFQTFYWAHDDRLWDGTQSFTNYASYIQQLHGTTYPLPTLPN